MSAQSDSIQELATLSLKAFSSREGTVLLYAEVEEGAISADLFFQPIDDSIVQFRFAPSELRDRVYSFWKSGFANVAPRSWATMELVVTQGRVSVELKYPDQIDPNKDVSDRRPEVLLTHFPNATVDYSYA